MTIPKIYKNTVCNADGIPVVLYEGQCHNRFYATLTAQLKQFCQ